jgi:hypothetical protein
MDAFTDQSGGAASIAIVDARGRPASVDGAPVWASSDDTIVAVTAAADGMSATFATVGPGTARLSITADADLGAGVVQISGVSEDIVVSANPNSQASAFTVSLTAPTDNP